MSATNWDLPQRRKACVHQVAFSLKITEKGMKDVKFEKHKAKGFWGEIKDENGKVFWGQSWSRA